MLVDILCSSLVSGIRFVTEDRNHDIGNGNRGKDERVRRGRYIIPCGMHCVDSIEIMPGVRASNDRCLILDDGPTVVIGDLHLEIGRAHV